ncbi:MAG TPA: J domain-containing protein [Streptosporangiaceae bacterium]|nr:J domain-containing protein [Streptosporangiaceae bacterium]
MTGWSPRQQEADPYGLLGLDRGASRADVIRAYHRQARFVHPAGPGPLGRRTDLGGPGRLYFGADEDWPLWA